MIELNIPNMACGGCAKGVTAAIRSVDGNAQVRPDLASRLVSIETTAPEAAIRDALADAGFTPK